MRLYVMRHAEALAYGGKIRSDAERPLSARGRRQVQDIARQLLDMGAEFSRIVCSPLLRTRETADAMAASRKGVVITLAPQLAPGELPLHMREWISGRYAQENILLIAHQPDIGMMAAALGHPEPVFDPGH